MTPRARLLFALSSLIWSAAYLLGGSRLVAGSHPPLTGRSRSIR